jgi:hypothetical protein
MTVQRCLALSNLIGLLLATIGGLLMAYALTLKPSSYRLVKTADGKVAICLDDKKVTGGWGGELITSDEACPDMAGNGPTAQIEANRPGFASWGLWLVISGFALQVPGAVFAVFF